MIKKSAEIFSGILLICAGDLGIRNHASADTLEPVLLKVAGGVGQHSFSLADLDALPQHQFATTTNWTVGLTEFSGPALADVLAASGVPTETLRLLAANNYSIQLEPSMIEATVPIVATRINGETFGLRDRGPLWLVYPYDGDPRFRTESMFAASIWQLTDISSDVAP